MYIYIWIYETATSVFQHIFTDSCRLGWIRNGHGIQNTFVNCRFRGVFTFLGNLYYTSIILSLLLIPSWALAIAYRLPIDCP